MRFLIPAFLLFITCASSCLADAVLPAEDIPGARDPSFLKRFQGSFIVAYRQSEFDEFDLPLSGLKKVPGMHDEHNNTVFKPAKVKHLEGKHTRMVYLLPANATAFEAVSNYKRELVKKGGRILFACRGGKCGGDPHRGSSGGGGEMSLSMYFETQEDITSYNRDFSNGYCALLSRINDQRYLSGFLPLNNAYISVIAYTIRDDGFCRAFNDRTVAVVDVVQPRAMEQKMVLVKAKKMASEIESRGRIALYGIYFDTGKWNIKAESRPTLEEIDRLLRENPGLRLLVVGHTDNRGGFDYNMDLSRKRAGSVVDYLCKNMHVDPARLRPVGVGYACPRASNGTEKGRAANRRVELVKDSR